ncbi:MAG TPA: metallophosphoesterase family protein [Terriglobales bacterium]|nr:metallophosphoesterase family protein [Terriglobales bacterium]
MRLLIVSDIHANLQALDACSGCFPAYDFVWNLGDVVGYGANPNEAVARSRQLGAVFVRGNHDKACSGISDLDGFNPVAALAAIWTQKQLTPANLEWLRKLPQGPVRPDLELDLACVHGSPGDEDEYLINAQDAAAPLAHPVAPVTFFGHTHLQGGFMRNATNVHGIHPQYRTKNQPERIELRLENDKTYMINPGSIGQPRDGDPRAAFALYDSDERLVTFYRVPYDIDGAQKTILGVGLPPRLASRLAEGR